MRVARKPPLDFASLFAGVCVVGRASLAGRPSGPLPFARGRMALEAGLSALGIKAGQRVLLPGYICSAVLRPLRRLGLEHQYYPLLEDFSPAWDALEAAMPQAQAALLLHPFGQPQDSARFGAICRRHGVVFIEDNAHGLGAGLDGKALGEFGDMGLVAPWKQYGVPHGALLYLSGEAGREAAREFWAQCPTAPLALAVPFAKAVIRALLTRIPALRLRLLTAPHLIPEAEEAPAPPLAAHPAVLAALARLEPEQNARVRRELHMVWQGWTSAAGLRPAFPSLGNGAAPLCFAAYADHAAGQRAWLDWGWRHDIAVHTWPDLPDDAPAEARAMHGRLLCFPIHQALRPEELRRKLAVCPPPIPGGKS